MSGSSRSVAEASGDRAGREGVATTWAEAELSDLAARGLRRALEPLEGPQGPLIRVGGQSLINFSSNDYLGLAADPRVVAAAREALTAYGVGTGASRLVVGDTLAHRSLEARLARFGRSEAALLFNTGYAANVGVLSTLLGPEDVVFSDALNHASIIDGCRLSRARVVVYPHADPQALERALRAVPGRRRLVVTDAVFSMDGDRAPLSELVALCRAHRAALMVDEAHALGVLGPRGQGLVAELGLEADVDLRVGTLGKALGSAGAFVLASGPLAELLMNRARSLVFSTALPAACCAAAETALGLLEADPSLRERLWANLRAFAGGLGRLGWPAPPRSPIFPVLLGTPERAVAAARGLRERGVLAKPIRPPTVPPGTSRLRFALSAAHTPAQVQAALDALASLEVP